jgi:riboflavin biosynthesis pyrimidine reductase
MPALLDDLGAQVVVCEGGPALLRELVAQGCMDELFLTVSPLLAAGAAPTVLAGDALDPPRSMVLAGAHRADEHVFLHYRSA